MPNSALHAVLLISISSALIPTSRARPRSTIAIKNPINQVSRDLLGPARTSLSAWRSPTSHSNAIGATWTNRTVIGSHLIIAAPSSGQTTDVVCGLRIIRKSRGADAARDVSMPVRAVTDTYNDAIDASYRRAESILRRRCVGRTSLCPQRSKSFSQ